MEKSRIITKLSISLIFFVAIVALTSTAFGSNLAMLDVTNEEEVTNSIWGPEEDGMKKRPADEGPRDRGRPPCMKKEKDLQELIRIERELSQLWYEYNFVTVEFNRLNNIRKNPLDGPPMTDEEWAQHLRHLRAVEASLRNIERKIAQLQARRRELINERGCEQSAEDNSLASKLADYTSGVSNTLTAKQSSEEDRLKARLQYLSQQIRLKWDEWNSLQEKHDALKDEMEDIRRRPIDPNWTHEEHIRNQEEEQRRLWALRKDIELVLHRIDLVEVDIYELRGQEDMVQRKLDKLQG